MRRRIVNIRKDRQRFTRTATKTKKINIKPLTKRGGTCL